MARPLRSAPPPARGAWAEPRLPPEPPSQLAAVPVLQLSSSKVPGLGGPSALLCAPAQGIEALPGRVAGGAAVGCRLWATVCSALWEWTPSALQVRGTPRSGQEHFEAVRGPEVMGP